MEKKIKIKSTSLTPLNETLQKLKLNDTIKDFTPVIVEADGKFTSIMNTKEEFNPNDVSSSFETEDVETAEQKETKEQLLNKAKDALKQTLTNSKELNDILQKIQELSKESGYNTWELNKEKNTATLKSKNAAIFKQNNNLCLSHGGKIELFHSVEELRDWLKEKGYPLPGNDIVIHESVEVKEDEDSRNWIDLLNSYNDKKKADAISTELDSNDNDNEININIVNEYDDLFRRKSDLEKQLDACEAKIKVASYKIPIKLSPKEAFDAGNITKEDYEAFVQVGKLRKEIAKTEKAAKKFYKDNDLDTVIPAVNKYKRSFNRDNRAMNSLGKPIPKEILQAANRQKPAVKFNRSFLQKQTQDTDVEECCGGACVSTAALGPAVAYTASIKKKEEKEETKEDLQEAKPSWIPGDVRMFDGDRTRLNAFLTWYKRNKSSIDSGEVKLPKDFKDTFTNEIEPAFLNHGASDSVSRVWMQLINKLLPIADAKYLEKYPEAAKMSDVERYDSYMSNPPKFICTVLSNALNKYIGDKEEYAFGKVQLIPGKSLVTTKKDNPNYQQRQNWQKAYFMAKVNGDIAKHTNKKEKPEDHIISYQNLKNYVNKPVVDASKYTPEELELIKKYNLASIKTESTIFEAAKSYPWLNKILGQRLTEDDTPADFASGTPISSDMSSTDTSTTSTTTTDTSSTDTNVDVPDIGMSDTTGSNKPTFGDININGGYSPDEGEDAAPMPIDMPEYKIIDVLMNDDNNDIKVKVQNTDTKETEVKDLEDIDI